MGDIKLAAIYGFIEEHDSQQSASAAHPLNMTFQSDWIAGSAL